MHDRGWLNAFFSPLHALLPHSLSSLCRRRPRCTLATLVLLCPLAPSLFPVNLQSTFYPKLARLIRLSNVHPGLLLY